MECNYPIDCVAGVVLITIVDLHYMRDRMNIVNFKTETKEFALYEYKKRLLNIFTFFHSA